MPYGRVGCLIVCLILAAANSGGGAQVQTDNYKPLFENPDFRVFSVREPDELPSVSKDSNFGVLVFRDDPMWDGGRNCPFCFTGPTGSRNELVYGTPNGVVPVAEKHFDASRHPVWIAARSDAEITEQVFKKNLPEDFTHSVRSDLFAIGGLADRVRSGAKPSEKEQTRASAALRDLDTKSKWLSFYEGSDTPPVFIKVKVHTVRAGVEISKWTVSYVLDGWEGDKDHTYTFDNESSPTEQPIVPGRYKMWASRGKKQGPSKVVMVGDTPSLTKELQLEIP